MGERIYLGRIPQSPEERRELIAQRIAESEELTGMALSFIQKAVIQFLAGSKGYSLDECMANKQYSFTLADGTAFQAAADIIITLEGRSVIMIKCVSSSLESWERYCVAFCRVAEPSLIPLAVITDSESVRIIDTLNGSLVGEEPAMIPSRDEARLLSGDARVVSLPPEVMERERRILFAFDAIRCPAAKEEPSF